MTKELKTKLIQFMTTEITEDDDSYDYFHWDLDRIQHFNECIKHPEYIMASNIAVDLLDQCDNIGQAKTVCDILPSVLDEMIRMINVNGE